MSELAFSLSLEDVVAYSDPHYQHSAVTTKARRRLQVGFALLFLGLGGLASAGGRFEGGIPYFVLGAAWFVVFPRLQRWATQREVLKMYREGTNRALFGVHRLRVDSDGIAWSSEHSEGKYKWSAIERVATAPDYTFVYVGAVMALIVPRRAVENGDYEVFIRAVADHFQSPRVGS